MFDKEIMWQSVSEAARVGIAGHIRPDGDCIGSCLAMYNYITENYGCSVTVYIEELPEKYATCIEMYFFYDISYKDISEITEFPINTVKSNIFRAKKMLKEKLEKLDER